MGMTPKAMGPGAQTAEAGRPAGPAWDLQTLLRLSQREPSGAWGLAEQKQRPHSPKESCGRGAAAPTGRRWLPPTCRVPWLQSPRPRVTVVVTTQSSSFLPQSGARGRGRAGLLPGGSVCAPVLGMEQEGDDHWGEQWPGAPSPALRTSDSRVRGAGRVTVNKLRARVPHTEGLPVLRGELTASEKEKRKEREVAHWCPTLCDSVDCSLPDFSIHAVFQAREQCINRGTSPAGLKEGSKASIES